MREILTVNGADLSQYISTYKVTYPVLSSPESGRDSRGYNHVYKVREIRKVICSFGSPHVSAVMQILNALSPYVVTVRFLDPRTNTVKTMQANINTPEPDYKKIKDGVRSRFKPMNMDFTEI